MNAGGQASLEPIENVFWASSRNGKYKVYVKNFNNKTDDKTVFTDRNRKVPFRVKMTKMVLSNGLTPSLISSFIHINVYQKRIFAGIRKEPQVLGHKAIYDSSFGKISQHHIL